MDNNSTMLYKQPSGCSAVNTGRKNGFAQICSRQICGKNAKTEFKIYLRQTPRVVWYAKNLCPRFTPQFCILQHRHREKFFANPFFCPVELFEKVPARLPVTKGFFHVAAGKITPL